MALRTGEGELPVLERLRLSSSTGSDGQRSSSDRNDVATGSSSSDSDSDDRLGQDGNAHEESWLWMVPNERSSVGVMVLRELYEVHDPYVEPDEPYIVTVASSGLSLWSDCCLVREFVTAVVDGAQ